MDAMEFLQPEHQKATRAFETLLITAPAERGAHWSELKPELQAHEKIEEQCLYWPIARDGASDRALSEWVSDRHQDEVYEVEGLIKETEGLDPQDGRWLATVEHIKRLEQAGRELRQSKAEKAGRRGWTTRVQRKDTSSQP